MTIDRPDVASTAKEVTDEELMRRYQRGDASAFEQLYRRHKKPVFNFCMRMTNNRDRASDAMQEIFTRVIVGSRRWTERAKFTTWLYTIARNYLIDQGKKKRETIDGEEREIEHDPPTGDPPLRVALNDAIAALPEEQREVFLLRAYAEMTFEEVGSIVGSPANTAKSRMRLAVTALKKRLKGAGVVPES